MPLTRFKSGSLLFVEVQGQAPQLVLTTEEVWSGYQKIRAALWLAIENGVTKGYSADPVTLRYSDGQFFHQGCALTLRVAKSEDLRRFFKAWPDAEKSNIAGFLHLLGAEQVNKDDLKRLQNVAETYIS